MTAEDKNSLGDRLNHVSEQIERSIISQTSQRPKNPPKISTTSNHHEDQTFEILQENIQNLDEKKREKLRTFISVPRIWFDFGKIILNEIIENLLLVYRSDLITIQSSSVLGKQLLPPIFYFISLEQDSPRPNQGGGIGVKSFDFKNFSEKTPNHKSSDNNPEKAILYQI